MTPRRSPREQAVEILTAPGQQKAAPLQKATELLSSILLLRYFVRNSITLYISELGLLSTECTSRP